MKYLEKTHEKMIQTFRKKHPLLPIILISKPDFKADDTEKFLRRDVIYSTYIHAIHAGDKNIYFIDGYSLFQGNDRDSCTVDGLHPNDLGFYRMAETIESIVREVLSSQH
ncbi:MAG: SGNH/GDSL hydrolase family protein, partial [Oscillospiraceae bacterium]